MDIWGTIFKKRREAEAAINRAIGAAVEHPRMPRGPQKSAEWGASVRASIFEVVEAVEAKKGSYAFAVAGPEQALMISRELQAALREHELSGILEPVFPLMFTTPATKADLIERWPEAVASLFRTKEYGRCT